MGRPRVLLIVHPGAPCESLARALEASDDFEVLAQAPSPEDEFLAQVMATPPDILILDCTDHPADGLQNLDRLDSMGIRPAVLACAGDGRPAALGFEPGPKLSYLDPTDAPAVAAGKIKKALARAESSRDTSLTIADYLHLCHSFRLTTRLEGSDHNRREMVLEVVSGDLWNVWVGDLDGEIGLASVLHQVPQQINLREMQGPPARRQPDFEPPATSKPAASPSQTKPGQRTMKLLLVEPEAGTVKEKLEDEGSTSLQGWTIEILHEHSLETAVPALEQGDVDLVALDLAVSGEAELKSFGQLRVRAPRVPVVVVTDLENVDLGFKALERGAQEYLVKEQLDGLRVASLLVLARKRHELASLWSSETLEAQTREANLRALLSSVGEAIVVLEAGGEVVFQNRRAEALLDLADLDVVARLAARPTTVTGRDRDGHLQEVAVEASEISWSGRPATLFYLCPSGQRNEQRAEDLDQLILTLANEQRGALAAFKGFLDLLRKGKVEDPGIQAEFFDSMHQQAERLSSLVDDLPDLVKMGDGRLDLSLTEVGVVGVISETLLTVRGPAEEKGLELAFAPPQDSLEVRGDRDRLCEALGMLLDNAIKFSDPSGTVDLVAERVSGDGQTHVAIRVRDDGPGIPDDVKPRLFERFFQGGSEVKRSSGGAGLGLYKAHQIVEAHGGRIAVDSTVGEGCTVSILLPALARDEPGGSGSGSGKERDTQELSIPPELLAEVATAPDPATVARRDADRAGVDGGPAIEPGSPVEAATAADGGLAAGLHIIWLGGASCDGCSMAVLGASNPGIEQLLLGNIADVPPVTLVHPALAVESGAEYIAILNRAIAGQLGPYVVALEGSIFDESLAGDGYFSHLGDDEEGRPLTIADWVDRLSLSAAALVAVGSCATWGGIPAALGSPTGAMGLGAYLGDDFTERTGVPIINVPGCAPSGEAVIETVVAAVFHLLGLSPLELDDELRPRWLYQQQAHPMPPRVAYLPASAYDPTGKPSVGCPVHSQGWMNRVGGCANVGGACIGCTAPDFVDRYLSFARLDAAPDA